MYSFLSNASFYETSGFLTIQQAVDQVLIERFVNESGNALVFPFEYLVTTQLLPSDEPIVVILVVTIF